MPRAAGIFETATRVSRVFLLVGVAAHSLALRWFLESREACLEALARFGALARVVDALLVVAAIVHGVSLVRHALATDVESTEDRDRRVLLGGSFVVSLALFGLHAYHGPLGAAVRGFDAFGTYEAIRRGFATTAGASIHAFGLVAIVLQVYETMRLSRDRSPRPAIAAVLVAILLVAAAFDPIADITIGRPLFVRREAPAGMIFPTDSARLAPR